MKKRIITTAILICSVALSGICLAAPQTDPKNKSLSVSTTIPELFELDLWVQAIVDLEKAPVNDPVNLDPYDKSYAMTWGEMNDPQPLNFGTFSLQKKTVFDQKKQKDVTYGIWVPQRFFCIFLSVTSNQDKQYTITHTCTNIDDAIKKALLLVADYCEFDEIAGEQQLALPQGSQVPNEGVKQFAYGGGSPMNIYQSDAIGETRILRCWYTFAVGEDNEPSGAVPLQNIATGTYTADVTFTLTE